MAEHVERVKNVSSGVIVCGAIRIKPNQTVDIPEKKCCEALKKLITAVGPLIKV